MDKRYRMCGEHIEHHGGLEAAPLTGSNPCLITRDRTRVKTNWNHRENVQQELKNRIIEKKKQTRTAAEREALTKQRMDSERKQDVQNDWK